jgi:hypothetical protein
MLITYGHGTETAEHMRGTDFLTPAHTVTL